MRGLLLGYIFEPRPNNRAPGYDFRLITKQMLALENLPVESPDSLFLA